MTKCFDLVLNQRWNRTFVIIYRIFENKFNLIRFTWPVAFGEKSAREVSAIKINTALLKVELWKFDDIEYNIIYVILSVNITIFYSRCWNGILNTQCILDQKPIVKSKYFKPTPWFTGLCIPYKPEPTQKIFLLLFCDIILSTCVTQIHIGKNIVYCQNEPGRWKSKEFIIGLLFGVVLTTLDDMKV